MTSPIAHANNFTLFSWPIGLVMIGLIFLYGTRLPALAWGIIFVFEPLTAAFFPVKVLPTFLQRLAWALPPTYLFEAARGILDGGTMNWSYAAVATLLNSVYFIGAAIIFGFFFRKSKDSG